MRRSRRIPSGAGTGTTLSRAPIAVIVGQPSLSSPGLLQELETRAFETHVAPTAAEALAIVKRAQPTVAIVEASLEGAERVLRDLERHAIPAAVVGNSAQLRRLDGRLTLGVGLLAPADPVDVANAAVFLPD